MTLHKAFGPLAMISTSIAISTSAEAKSADHLRDLVGGRASSGESELESRGFTYITGRAASSDTKYGYWWSGKAKDCVRVETYDGRYNTIVDVPNSDCNQKDSSGNAGAAVAAVAGVAVLAAVLAHKSDHHDDGKHYSSGADESQYDRGYTDGLHNYSYHNYDRSNAYSNGYQAGVNQRSLNGSHHYGSGGYAAVGQYKDLKGARASSVDGTLKSRGFSNVDSFKSGNTAYTIWNRRSSYQCVQVTVAEGHVYDIRDIGSHPKCR